MEDATILRRLAWAYKQITADARNAERMQLHIAVNDLKPIRPVVIIDELPWSELNINDELTLLCTDPFLRSIEWFFRAAVPAGGGYPWRYPAGQAQGRRSALCRTLG